MTHDESDDTHPAASDDHGRKHAVPPTKPTAPSTQKTTAKKTPKKRTPGTVMPFDL